MHRILFVEDNESLPVSFVYHADGIVIYPNKTLGKWMIKFNGQEIIPNYPTVLSEYL